MLQVQYISACKPGKQIVKVLGAIFVVKLENTKFRYEKSAIIAKISVMSPILINTPTRELLAGDTKT